MRLFLHSFLMFLLYCSGSSYAQNSLCVTMEGDASVIQQREQTILALKKQLVNAKVSFATTTYIPIKPHVVRNSDGTGGITLANLNNALLLLNKYYINAGVQFYFCGDTPNYIDNSDYFDFSSTKENNLATADVTNAINLYVVGTLSYNGSSFTTGYSYFPSTLAQSNRLFITLSGMSDGRTFLHEMGHFFNLYHTYQNSTTVAAELVTRTSPSANCATSGDFVCDTPADPFGKEPSTIAVDGCRYVGTALDAMGSLYAPQLSNIMSYYPPYCGNIFTPGQYSRIADGLMLRKSPLNQYSYNCSPVVVGAAVPSNIKFEPIKGSGGDVKITFNDNSPNEMGFIVERSSVSVADGFMPIAALSADETTFSDTTTLPAQVYYYRIRASNSMVYSTVYSYISNYDYCTPTYATNCATTEFPAIIDDFILKSGDKTIISNAMSGCSPNNYGNYSNIMYNITKGVTYSLLANARVGLAGTCAENQHLSVWIDYNRNGNFEADEIAYQSGSATSPPMSLTAFGNITIPLTASTGIARMRVRSGCLSDGIITDPCGQLTDGETEDYTLFITELEPFIKITSISPNPSCSGQNVGIAFETNLPNNIFKVQLSDAAGENFEDIPTSGITSPLTAQIPIGTPSWKNYRLRIVSLNPVVIGDTSTTFAINTRPDNPVVTPVINYVQEQASTPLTAIGQNLRWHTSILSGTSGSVTPPTPSTDSVGTKFYWVTQTVNGCESGKSVIEVTVKKDTLIDVCIKIKAYLEGSYIGGFMNPVLNQKGLLPGQQPKSSFGLKTKNEHPYKGLPWEFTAADSAKLPYPSDVVDWVLVSLRTKPDDVSTTVFKSTAYILADGKVVFPSVCPQLYAAKPYYITLDHRNHMGVMSHIAITQLNTELTYDFTKQDSYVPAGFPSHGQIKVGEVYCLYATDGEKNKFHEINALDANIWRIHNGKIERYLIADFNLDGVINAIDELIWRKNNGKFSGVKF